MESGSGFNEEEQMSSKGKLPFSYSSSSSPSPSSNPPQIYDKHQLGSWLGSKYDPEDDNEITKAGDEEPAVNAVIDKEHMFDKVVTPSDVGKLNRLVIPKQHAEKYFPLDSSTNEKGLLLNFEDKTGKEWRFRYSYWNSSQSYVMTKGWSRFVKEKKLDAGDIVSFQRGVGGDRLYIDWRRRPDAPDPTFHHHHHHHHFSSIPWSPLLMRPPPAAAAPPVPLLSRDHFHLSNPNRNGYYTGVVGGGGAASPYGSFGYGANYNNHVLNPSGSGLFLRSAAGPQMVQWQQQGGGGSEATMVYESVPVVQGKAAAKRLRLFGVNLDCPVDSDHNHHQSEILSSTMAPLQSPPHALPLPLRLYNGTPVPGAQFLRKEPSMSLDLDI